MEHPKITRLSGNRLHLHHGPIDIVAKAEGAEWTTAYAKAAARFETLLTELVAELSELRKPIADQPKPQGATARAMCAATTPFAPDFVTPMAAVAGAVADTICAEMAAIPGITRAYANNGGDVAFHLVAGQTMTAALAATGDVAKVPFDSRIRGVATSGWRGRSHSLGIADAVTVLAFNAARADAAATLIANAIDLPDHPGILRRPATTLFPDSDLGSRLVTTEVPPLTSSEVAEALEAGTTQAETFRARDLINAACLCLQGEMRVVGSLALS